MIAPQGKLVVMEVFSHKVFKAFRAADPLKSVQPNDKVWCFECHDDASALKPVQARTRTVPGYCAPHGSSRQQRTHAPNRTLCLELKPRDCKRMAKATAMGGAGANHDTSVSPALDKTCAPSIILAKKTHTGLRGQDTV